ncbi:DUF6407 family protein [Halalkalibacter urbisdiaboli]|uniref:DUF6407 family protein n=1 Tax=Halalkalibacter urbisdiaboli TaxID=1960589 RepID=UPI000B4360A7|nr:DUF6407 family protein [Halalkalibacter urbisdiaboli]
MQPKKTIVDFVNNITADNPLSITEVIKVAIDYYRLNSTEKVERTETGEVKILYIASMAEENMLTKIVTLIAGEDADIESAYNGCIVRAY